MSSTDTDTDLSRSRLPGTAAGHRTDVRRQRGRRPQGLPWILPAFIFVVGLIYYCIVYTGYISTLTGTASAPDPGTSASHNYSQLFHDPVFWDTIQHTIIFFVVTFVVQTALGFVVRGAAALARSRLPNLYKVIIFIPVVLAPATMAPIFRQIFSATGQFNTVLQHIGLGFLAQPWLAQSSTALPVIMAITIWEWHRHHLHPVLRRDDPDRPGDSGGGPDRRRRRLPDPRQIVWPSCRGTTVALAMLSVIGALKTFDVPYLVTLGGPNYATEFLGTFIYRISIPQDEVGYGAALSIMLLILALGGASPSASRGMRRTNAPCSRPGG